MTHRVLLAFILVSLLGHTLTWAAREKDTTREPAPSQKAMFHSDVPAYDVNVIVGSPTSDSALLSVFAQPPLNLEIRYGSGGDLNRRTQAKKMQGDSTSEFMLTGLERNSRVSYRLYDTDSGRAIDSEFARGTFQTARPRGEGFSFTIQADSHLDGDTIPSLYEQTLANIALSNPDFHIDLGDAFMTDKTGSQDEAEMQYLAQRYYLGRVGHSAPLFLVLGNHDGISGQRQGRKKRETLTTWSSQQRDRFFPAPRADDFYLSSPDAGQFHYAWNWGDALFVVLDPYSQSAPTKSGQEPWNMTLGRQQYEWLAGILRESDAKFKFVFIHQLPGGLGKGGRGGLEAASLYEWGGFDESGEWQFGNFRPEWEQPVHALLRETHVSAVFHGHDHFFAYQVLDDIVYQLVPQPAHRNHRRHHAGVYGYESGTFIPNSGHLQVNVTSGKAVVRYIRSVNNQLKKARFENGEVAFSYEIDTASSISHSQSAETRQ